MDVSFHMTISGLESVAVYVLWKVVGVSGKIYSDVGSCWLMAFQKVEDDVQYLVMSPVIPPVVEGLVAVVQYMT